MEQNMYTQLKHAIDGALGKTHLAGLKAESLHHFMRACATSLHFKWIEKKEMKVEGILQDLDKDIQEHLVSKAEDAEHHAIKYIVKDHVYLYLTIHSLMLFEKHDLAELEHAIVKFRKFCEKRGLSGEVKDEAVKTLNDIAEEWRKELDHFRKMLNSVWATAKGGEGWSLTWFRKMHKEGFFVRFQERRHFRQALHDEDAIESAFDKIKDAKSKEELEKLLNTIKAKDEEMIRDFDVVFKMLFSTWDHITQQMDALVKAVADAVGIHELPSADSEQMQELHELINHKLNEKYLHDLRIDDKQLESEYAAVKAEIAKIK